MDCICLKRKRKKKGQQSKVQKGSGQKNSAYVSDDDEDMMKNNAVLDEMDASKTALADEQRVELTDTVESADGNQTSQASTNVSIHLSPSDKSLDTPDSLLASSTQLFGTQDDLCLSNYNYDCYDVQLVSKDSSGPGFSVTGTVTDGIVIRNIHENGPAMQSGQMAAGDRLLSVTIGFNNMAYEDALTILSYAAPYPMVLKLARRSDQHLDNVTHSIEQTGQHSKIYHPVYRSQSVGAAYQAKKVNKIPSRPGTSLGQDYKTREMFHEDSRDSPDGALVKGKFGNTLNLINGSEIALHTLNGSDTTVDSSVRSESQLQGSSPAYVEASEEVATTFSAPMQAVAGSPLDMAPVIAEVMVTEPPTQLKIATNSSSSPIPDEMYTSAHSSRLATPDTHSSTHSSRVTTPDTHSSTHSSRVTTPTSPSQIPPEKPKRIHQLIAAGEMLPIAPLQNSLIVEEEICPSTKVVEPPKLGDHKEKCVNTDEVFQEKGKHTQSLLVLEAAEIEDVEIADEIDNSSSPVEEPIIQPYLQVKQESFNTKLWVDNDADVDINTDAVSRPSTLTVDTVKINDTDVFQIESSAFRDPSSLAQQSPNDSGIHSEKAPSEQDEPASPLDGASSSSSSPKLNLRHEVSSSSDDIMSAVLGLTERKEQEVQSPSTPTSQPLTPSYVQQPPNIKRRRPRPHSAGSTSGLTMAPLQPAGPVIPKATSRSQLEAARARFFAELMQTSEIFKDEPVPSLSFSSDSLNAETSLSSAESISKHTSSNKTTTSTNNNTLPSGVGLSTSWTTSDTPSPSITEQESSA